MTPATQPPPHQVSTSPSSQNPPTFSPLITEGAQVEGNRLFKVDVTKVLDLDRYIVN